jgi:hypothetical protein
MVLLTQPGTRIVMWQDVALCMLLITTASRRDEAPALRLEKIHALKLNLGTLRALVIAELDITVINAEADYG